MRSAAAFSPRPSWELNTSFHSTELVDTDYDGKADYLRLHFGLIVDREADYVLQAGLYTGYGGLANAYRAMHLPQGNTTVDMDFSGISIGRFDQDGPWPLGITIDRAGWPSIQVYNDLWMTPDYRRTDFESRPVARIDVSLTFNPCPVSTCEANLAAYDPTTGFIVAATPDAPESLPVYNGTFYVLVYPGNVAFPSVVREATILGDGQLSITINSVAPDSIVQTYDFPALNLTDVTTEYTEFGYAPQVRWHADVFGDRNGLATTTEIAAMQGFDPPFVWPQETRIWIGQMAMSPADPAFTGIQGADAVTSSAPLTETGSTRYAVPVPIAAGTRQNITIAMPWTGPYFNATYHVRLPGSIQAELTTMFPGTLTRLGPTEWLFKAGTLQYPDYAPATLRIAVNLEAGNTPDALTTYGPFVLVAVLAAASLAIIWMVLRLQKSKLGRPPPQHDAPPPT